MAILTKKPMISKSEKRSIENVDLCQKSSSQTETNSTYAYSNREELVICPVENCSMEVARYRLKIHMKSKF